jgi:lipid-A-disaccharide synthase
VLGNLRLFFRLVGNANDYFRDHDVDAVVLIDYPGFNWWIARKAKAQGIPVVYYGTPQLWAWAGWRVKKMRRLVDHVLCKLPFEEDWFRQRGCHATFVGHPYFDELRAQQLDAEFLAGQNDPQRPLVTILPGSRNQEIRLNLPALLKAAKRVREQVPGARFAVAAYKQSQLENVYRIVAESPLEVEVHVGRTAELIHAARCCMPCSGSVSLELLYHARPSVILYQISRLGFFVQSLLRTVRYITLVNLLTAEEPFAERSAGHYHPEDPQDGHVLMPEYLTCRDRSAELAEHVVTWLTDETEYQAIEQSLIELRERVGQGGASQRAAEYMTGLFGEAAVERTTGEPHYRRTA